MSATDATPVLWFCGPPGVGKTAVGWAVYSQLVATGVPAGYVDIDQLGMCYPEPSSDPGRYRTKARNLDAVISGYRGAGAACVVVSGVVDPAHVADRDEIPEADLVLCRLRCDAADLRRRLEGRQGSVADVGDGLREADTLDQTHFADLCVDTTGMSVDDAVRCVRRRVGDWPGEASTTASAESVDAIESETCGADGRILWVLGPTGVGKSTIGFSLYLKVLRAGATAAYVDVGQIGFCSTAPSDHRLRARNLAAVWQIYRSVGAETLVVVGPVGDASEVAVYERALPAVSFTCCRLHATREELTKRIASRGDGGSWPEPGDRLRGLSEGDLGGVVEEALREADELEAAGIGLRIDTDRLTVEESADLILSQTSWQDERIGGRSGGGDYAPT